MALGMIYQTESLRKHAHMIYSNFFRSKIDNFQRKNSNIFLIFAQNIDCGYTLEPPRRGGSNQYPQSMFWSKNKKNRYTTWKPQFFYIKVGSRGYTSHGHVFVMQVRLKGMVKVCLLYSQCNSNFTIFNTGPISL